MNSLIATGDLRIASTPDFSATTAKVAPVTEKGKAWFRKHHGEFAESVTVRKSSLAHSFGKWAGICWSD